MKVIIREREYDYVSDHPIGWKFSAGDDFKFPVEIGTYKCFIKRFEKKTPENISGWHLLVNLKGKYEQNLPRIHDIISTKEKGRDIHYVFYEFIEGDTLEKLIEKDVEVNLKKLTEDLFNALQSVHNKDYWFADFCEKNIFCDKRGRFLLIDLDSTQPISEAPNSDMFGNKEYWALVFNFYKDILRQKFMPSDIHGITLNYLQIIFLMLRLKIHYSNKAKEYKYNELFSHLPAYLNNISPAFKRIFDKVFQNKKYPLESHDIIEIKNLIKEEIIPLPDPVIDKIMTEEIIPLPDPIIKEFTVSNYDKKHGDDDYVVENGKIFRLNWDVQNAMNIELYKDGVSYKKLNTDKKSIDLTEKAYDGKKKKVEYTLVASNDYTQTDSKSLTISVKEFIAPEPPVINAFTAGNYFERNGDDDYAVENGKTFTLSWDVKNAITVELYKDGKPYKKFNAGEQSIRLTEETYDGKKKEIGYTLLASNGSAEIKSKLLTIKIIHPDPVINEFTVSRYLEKSGDEYVIENGKAFTLNWEVENAINVELYKDEEPFKKFTNNEKSIELKEEAYDRETKKIEYRLVASNGSVEAKSKSLTIKVIRPDPVINQFETNKYIVKNQKPFTLKWNVKNASNIELYKNGEFYKTLNPAEKNIEITEATYDGKERKIEFTLLASNGSVETKSNPVVITLKPVIPDGEGWRKYIKIIGIGLLALITIAIFWKFFYSPASEIVVNKIEPQNLYEDSTITVYGNNLSSPDKIQVLFNKAKGNIKSYSEDSLIVGIPKIENKILAQGIVKVTVIVDKRSIYSGNFHYFDKPSIIDETKSQAWHKISETIKASLLQSLNEIWYSGTGNRLININSLQNIIYYSTRDKNNYGTYYINEVYLDSTDTYKIITKTEQGFKVFFIKNVTQQSFELSVCHDTYKTIEEIQKIDKKNCDSFSNMKLYYENKPNNIYLPVANNSNVDSLQISQKTKLDKIVNNPQYKNGNKSNLFVNVTVFATDKFLLKPDSNAIARYLEASGANYLAKLNNYSYLNESNPFQRNYFTISIKPNNKPDTSKDRSFTADCNRTFTSIDQAKKLASPLIVCKLDLSKVALQTLPYEVYKFKNLQQLNLGSNPISRVEVDRLQRALPQCEIITNNVGASVVDLNYIQFDTDHELDKASQNRLDRIARQLLANPDSKITFNAEWDNSEEGDIVAANISALKNFYLTERGINKGSDQVDTRATLFRRGNKNLNRIYITGINFPPNFK